MARPKIDNPKVQLNVRALESEIKLLKAIGNGSKQKGVDLVLKYIQDTYDILAEYLEEQERLDK
jgi:hypothetical protein